MTATTIVGVRAWEALDSRGNPTVACEVLLGGGAKATVRVPSGASRGRHEVRELRDHGSRFGGLGVRTAIRHIVEMVGPSIRGMDAADQGLLDAHLRELDGTPDLERLGGNAVLAVSVAVADAAAEAHSTPLYLSVLEDGVPLLPMPMVNVLSGGAHAARAIDVQDLLVIPVGATSFAEALEWAWRVRRSTVDVVAERGHDTALVADEGGLAPRLRTNREALELLTRGIERSGLRPGQDVSIAIDIAASQFVDGPSYRLASEGKVLTRDELLILIDGWIREYPIVSVEDPLGDDDWEGWQHATARLGRLQLIGDDLFATRLGRLREGVRRGIANAVLVKPNQAGTLSDTLAVLREAQTAGYATILSARSGDTEDAWLADLAVGWRVGQIKIGSLTRSERTAKWNRLLAIEAEIGGGTTFAGRGILASRVAES